MVLTDGELVCLDHFTGQFLFRYGKSIEPTKTLILGPSFDVTSCPVIVMSEGRHIKVEDSSESGIVTETPKVEI